jgi:catechol 2,3-dioxygenase-like lactoylglutathione lyase family enzyme
MKIVGIDHVQIAAPSGAEDVAREFYGDLLGLTVLVKPPVLAARGGVWFECGPQQLHVGIEPDFRPARKAHPALLVSGLEELQSRLEAAGYEVRAGEDIPGVRRAFVFDPFGNRIELVEQANEESS